MSLAHLVRPHAARQPDAPALMDGALTLSYAELAQRVEAAAGFLRQHHVLPGHVVCIGLAPVDHWSWVFVLGAWRLGALPALLGEHPVAQIRALGGRGAIVVGSEGSALLRVPDIRPIAVNGRDKQAMAVTQAVVGLCGAGVADARAGLVVFGTGRPLRAAALDRAAVLARAESLAQLLGLDASSRLCPLLGDDAAAKVELAVSVWRRGGALVLPPAPVSTDSGFATVSGSTHLVSSAPRLMALLKGSNATAARACHVVVLGGPVPSDLAAACARCFGSLPEQWLYSNECGVFTSGNPVDFATRPGCVGRALAGTELLFLGRDGKPVAPAQGGLLVVRTPWAAHSYLHGTAGDTSVGLHVDGYRTGLIARLGEDGRLDIRGAVRAATPQPGSMSRAPLRTWSRGALEKAVGELAGVDEVCVLSQAASGGRPGVPAIVYVATGDSNLVGPLESRIQALLGAGQRFHLIQVPRLPRLNDGALDRERLAGAVVAAIQNARRDATAPANPGTNS